MSFHATELCLLLVDDSYGGLTHRVFGVLMCYGRLDFSALLHHTGLTPKQLKHSLVVLIQQHLAFWDVSAESDSSYYEANWRSAYDLARSGKLIKVVEDRYGQSVGGLVSNLLLSGHVSVSDLAQAYDLTPPEGKPDSSKLAKNGSTNGVLNGQPRYPVGSSTASVDHFYESLIILLNDDFVSIVNESHFRSEADNRLRAQSIIGKQERFQGQLKAAEKECYEHAVQQQLVDWKYSSNLSDKSIEMRASQILKRTKKRHAENELNGDERPEKRRRLSPDFDSANGLSTHVERDLNVHLEGSLVFRVNYEKLSIVVRNQKLVEHVQRHIGIVTSRVYAELLLHLERYIKCCSTAPSSMADDESGDELEENPTVPTTDVAAAMKDTEELAGSIALTDPTRVNLDQIIHPKNRRRKRIKSEDSEAGQNAASDEEEDAMDTEASGDAGANGDAYSSMNSDPNYRSEVGVQKIDSIPTEQKSSLNDSNMVYNLVQQHLLLLAEHPFQFATHHRRRHNRPESWDVDFSHVVDRIRLVELEQIIVSRYEREGLRIVRILQEKGKLDEKSIGSFALMPQKQMRSLLTRMHEAGHLELQEVPRDLQRLPSRTIFMWFFDADRCCRKVLEETYKTMARCLKRIKAEKETIQGVIDKAARTDVVGKEEEFLSVDERTALEAWREKEERLLGEVGRLDELVCVLRDF